MIEILDKKLPLLCEKMPSFSCFQLKQYKVIGRSVPTDKVRVPPLYQMQIFAPDKCTAKSRFWYFVCNLKKMKRTQGEIVSCQEVHLSLLYTQPVKSCFTLSFCQQILLQFFFFLFHIFSSPEHEVLMVSYCDRPLSVVRRRAACVVRKLFYLTHYMRDTR